MGCDIHFFVEKFDGKKWVSVDKWRPCKYEPSVMTIPRDKRFYTDRNYRLFAMLADVRNGWGAAGVVTGAGVKPISIPRGLPADVSPEIRAASNEHGIGGHSHSWLMLSELKAYDWHGQITRLRGVVDPEQYTVFKAEGKPREWSGGVIGYGVRYVSNNTMDKIIAGKIQPRNEVEYYTEVWWEETYAHCAGSFLTETMPKLEALSKGHDDSVRVVFFFDN